MYVATDTEKTNDARPARSPNAFNHPEIERPHKIIPKITYLNIMTKMANAIDFFKKIRFHENESAARLISTSEAPTKTFAEK